MQKEPTVAITQDERGQDWGYRKSCEMHRKKAKQIDKEMEMVQVYVEKATEIILTQQLSKRRSW